MSLDKLGPQPHQDGVKTESPVSDLDAYQLLSNILKELKMINIQLSEITGIEVNPKDID